jgi:hypothetical protein
MKYWVKQASTLPAGLYGEEFLATLTPEAAIDILIAHHLDKQDLDAYLSINWHLYNTGKTLYVSRELNTDKQTITIIRYYIDETSLNAFINATTPIHARGAVRAPSFTYVQTTGTISDVEFEQLVATSIG